MHRRIRSACLRYEQTEHVLTAGVVNESLNGNQGTAWRKRSIGRANEMHFLFEIPVMEDHTHRDDVCFGQRIFEEIPTSGSDAIAQPGCCDVLSRDRFNGRQIKGSAAQMRMLLCEFYREQAGSPPTSHTVLNFAVWIRRT